LRENSAYVPCVFDFFFLVKKLGDVSQAVYGQQPFADFRTRVPLAA
jgi:hypothetical protein